MTKVSTSNFGPRFSSRAQTDFLCEECMPSISAAQNLQPDALASILPVVKTLLSRDGPYGKHDGVFEDEDGIMKLQLNCRSRRGCRVHFTLDWRSKFVAEKQMSSATWQEAMAWTKKIMSFPLCTDRSDIKAAFLTMEEKAAQIKSQSLFGRQMSGRTSGILQAIS